MINLYLLTLLIPLITAIVWKFLYGKTFLQAIKDEYYFFIGYGIFFFALYVLLSFIFRIIAVLGSYITILWLLTYLCMLLFRNFIYTDSNDLHEKLKEVELLK
jgi:hypothetical protein